jgi:hypothetical protein
MGAGGNLVTENQLPIANRGRDRDRLTEDQLPIANRDRDRDRA